MNICNCNFAWEYQVKARGYKGFHLDLSKDAILEIIEKLKVFRKISITLCDYLPSQAIELKKLKPIAVSKIKINAQTDSNSELLREDNVLKISLNDSDFLIFLETLRVYHTGINDFNIKIGNDCIWFW